MIPIKLYLALIVPSAFSTYTYLGISTLYTYSNLVTFTFFSCDASHPSSSSFVEYPGLSKPYGKLLFLQTIHLPLSFEKGTHEIIPETHPLSLFSFLVYLSICTQAVCIPHIRASISLRIVSVLSERIFQAYQVHSVALEQRGNPYTLSG